MKKIIAVILAIAAVVSVSACKKETDESYADKLVNGEIKLDAETKRDSKDKTKEDESEKPSVNLKITDEEMGAYVDAAEADYESFEIVPVDSSDFFVNKKLRMAAMVQDHSMSMVYSHGIEAKFSENALALSVPNESGQVITTSYIVYTTADEVITTPNGKEFSYVAYGSEEITSDETDGAIGIMCLVKMREDVDMGDAAADTYVMLIETSNPDAYQIFKVEE